MFFEVLNFTNVILRSLKTRAASLQSGQSSNSAPAVLGNIPLIFSLQFTVLAYEEITPWSYVCQLHKSISSFKHVTETSNFVLQNFSSN